jgi:hypothetical protein
MLFSIYVDYTDREYLSNFCNIKSNDTVDTAAHKLVEIIRENRRELTRINDLKNS